MAEPDELPRKEISIVSSGNQALSMADALSEVRAESEQASPDVAEAGLPPVEANAQTTGEQAQSDNQDSPSTDENGYSVDASGLEQALLDTSSIGQNESDSGVIPGSDDFWNLEMEVQTVTGPQTVSIQELQDGYLRQADYTRKTQAVADKTKRLEKAENFLDTFEKDPATFIRSLAVQAGFLNEGDAPVKDIDIVAIPTQELLDEQMEKLVEERIGQDPRVLNAEITAAREQVNTEFDRLEKEFNVPLASDLRESLIREASERGTADLESLLARRILNAQQKQSKAADSNLASTARPGSLPTGVSGDTDAPKGEFLSIPEAWAQAKLASAQQ